MSTTNESGVDAGARNVGRFFLALVPWALGIGALVWLSVWIGVHTYRHEMAQEDRAAVYTGAAERPKAKVKIEVDNRSCVKVTHVDLDGTNLLMNGRNDCGQNISYGIHWNWQQLSPDGTILHSGKLNGAFCTDAMRANDKAECQFSDYEQPSDDDRVATLRVWIDWMGR